MNVTPERFRVELARKGIHMTTGILPLAYALGVSKFAIVSIFAVMTAAIVTVEIFRRGEGPLGRLFRKLFAFMLREHEHEKGKLLGTTPYCIASLICVLVLPKWIAVLALLYLAAGDTAASLVGLAWGKHKVGRKSWEGFAGFCAATWTVAIIAHWCSPDYLLVGGIAGGAAAGLAELFLPDWDDNWTVPAAGAAVMLLFHWI